MRGITVLRCLVVLIKRLLLLLDPAMASKRQLSPDTSTEQNGLERKRKKINEARKIGTNPSLGNTGPPGMFHLPMYYSPSYVISVLKPLPTSLDVVKFTEVRISPSNIQLTF
jgi:hypothetical protein